MASLTGGESQVRAAFPPQTAPFYTETKGVRLRPSWEVHEHILSIFPKLTRKSTFLFLGFLQIQSVVATWLGHLPGVMTGIAGLIGSHKHTRT